MTDTTTTDTERPDFAALAPAPMGRMFLETLYDSHLDYCDAFEQVYPDQVPVARFRSWRDSLPSVSGIVTDQGEDPTDIGDLPAWLLSDVARTSEDAAEVATVYRWAVKLTETATENLQGLHAQAKRRRNTSPETADAASVETMRLALNANIKIARQMADASFFTWEAVETLLPFTTTPKGRKNYAGPSLPGARKSPARSNTKRLQLNVNGAPAGSPESDLSTNVKTVLRLSMSELRDIIGEFTEENFGTEFKAPDGRTFTLTLRSDAPDEPDTDTESDDDTDQDS